MVIGRPETLYNVANEAIIEQKEYVQETLEQRVEVLREANFQQASRYIIMDLNSKEFKKKRNGILI